MDILYIIVLSIGSIIELFILCKCMGYRQLSQMSMFDYINGITIGNIAAEMATSVEDNFIHPLIAMIVYAAAAIFLSWICSKSIHARRFLAGKPMILVDQGKIFEANLRKSKIDLNEFLTQCRINGYFDISQLKSAVLEENGRISFLPKSEFRPLTPHDIQLSRPEEHLLSNLIIDGKLMPKNLKHSGKDSVWLDRQLKAHGIKNIEDVFLAVYDFNDHLTIYTYTSNEMPPDIFS